MESLTRWQPQAGGPPVRKVAIQVGIILFGLDEESKEADLAEALARSIAGATPAPSPAPGSKRRGLWGPRHPEVRSGYNRLHRACGSWEVTGALPAGIKIPRSAPRTTGPGPPGPEWQPGSCPA